MFADIETFFSCRIVAWAEWNGERDEYRAIDRNGRLVIADSVELLVLELVQRCEISQRQPQCSLQLVA